MRMRIDEAGHDDVALRVDNADGAFTFIFRGDRFGNEDEFFAPDADSAAADDGGLLVHRQDICVFNDQIKHNQSVK